MPRVWILLEALKRESPPAPRKLGATPDMLTWVVETFAGPCPDERLGLRALATPKNRTVLQAARAAPASTSRAARRTTPWSCGASTSP